MNNAQCKREREIVDQAQTQRYVSRFEHPALRPRLHTEGFPLNRPHRASHTGNSTEDSGNTNREYTTPLSNNTTSTQEAKHNTNLLYT